MAIEYSLSDYFNIVIKRRKHFNIILGTSLAVVILFSLLMPKIYRTELNMYMPSSVDVMSFGGGREGTQLRPLMPNLDELLSGAVLGLLKSNRMKEDLYSRLKEEDGIKRARFVIDYSPDYGNYEVKVNDRDPERAAKIANTIPEVANELIVQISGGSLRNNVEYVKAQLDTAIIELEEARAALRDFKEENIHVVLGQQSSIIITQNAQYQADYDRLGVEIVLIGATLDALNVQMEKEAQLFVEEEAVADDFIIQQLRNSLTQKEIQMANLRTQYTEFHPIVIATQKEIEDTRELIRREVERLFLSETKPTNSFYESLRQSAVQNLVELTSTKARREALKRLIDESDQILLSLPAIQNVLANIMFTEKVKESVVQSLVARLTELELQIGREFQSFIVIEEAEVPTSPSFPLLSINILLAIVFGGAGGFFYCVLLEYFERAKIVRYADVKEQ